MGHSGGEGAKILTKEQENTCPICINEFTLSKRKRVSCPHCSYTTCSECLATVLKMSSTDMVCMECSKPFDRIFLSHYLSKAFMNTGFRDYRKRVLTDRYKATLPEAQVLAHAMKTIENDRCEHRKLRLQLKNKENEEQALLERSIYWENRKWEIMAFVNSGKGKHPFDLRVDIETLSAKFTRGNEIRGYCPVNECPGLISHEWSCEVCHAKVCDKCFAILNCEESEEHQCEQSNLKKRGSLVLVKNEQDCPVCKTILVRFEDWTVVWCEYCKNYFEVQTMQMLPEVDTPISYYLNKHVKRCGDYAGPQNIDFGNTRDNRLQSVREAMIQQRDRSLVPDEIRILLCKNLENLKHLRKTSKKRCLNPQNLVSNQAKMILGTLNESSVEESLYKADQSFSYSRNLALAEYSRANSSCDEYKHLYDLYKSSYSIDDLKGLNQQYHEWQEKTLQDTNEIKTAFNHNRIK